MMVQRLPYPNERDLAVEDIVARIPELSDPDQMEILVTTALQLMLRRTEDGDMRDALTQAVRNAIESVRATSPREFADELHRTAINCVELIEAAREERIPRGVVMHPTPSESEAMHATLANGGAANANRRSRIGAHRLVIGFAILLGFASFGLILVRLFS